MSFKRGRPLAHDTKVVDHDLGPIKVGPTCLSVPDCVNDAVSSKPVSEPGTVGRDAADAHKQTSICNCVVRVYMWF